MKNPGAPQDADTKTPAPSRRQWVKPELVQYGHLAKLTRGPSGMFTEVLGMSPVMLCL